MRIIGLQKNPYQYIPTLFLPFMNLQNSIQRSYPLGKALVCRFLWIGVLPSKLPSCTPAGSNTHLWWKESIWDL